ncbi:MAG: 2-amino-4-hydroxy-6-hydroxymethyldihydropteridine diphosphokinase [Elusimicrobia bacterium]|nr:2-amino-4-hydroxy-6-hydroxymethyldihydropteridine diphosphokinase [Candidatus Obscuribacterium magneticum]
MTPAFIALGSNQGRRLQRVSNAVRDIRNLPDVHLEEVSSLYETEPVGGPPQRPFLNAVAKIKTGKSPIELLFDLQRIEKKYNRKSGVKWGPRPIDLDILTFGRKIVASQNLMLPHPRYHRRRFVLVPFCELAPKLIHPRLKVTNRTLLRRLTPYGQRVTIQALWKKSRFYPFKNEKKKKSPSRP